MKPGDQRLLHGANAATVILAWLAGTWLGGEPLAWPLTLGAGTTALCIAAIGLSVGALTGNGPTWMKAAAAMAFVGQLGFMGFVIFQLDPAGGPFAAGVTMVLGATVVAALIDGMKQAKQEGE
jgi:hypothetical protein